MPAAMIWGASGPHGGDISDVLSRAAARRVGRSGGLAVTAQVGAGLIDAGDQNCAGDPQRRQCDAELENHFRQGRHVINRMTLRSCSVAWVRPQALNFQS